MDAEILNALEQLWKPILAIGFILVLLVGLILFRDQIAGLISHVKSINVRYKEVGELEAKVDQSDKDTTAIQQIQEESVVDADKDSVEESSTTDNAYLTMLRAFVDSDFTTAKQAYEKKRAEVQSEDKRRELEAHYLSLCYIRAVDSGALDKLRALSSYKSTKVNVLRWLAYCYWST